MSDETAKPPPLKWRPWPEDTKDDALSMGQVVRSVVKKVDNKVTYAYAKVAGGHGMKADRPGQPVFVTNVADTPEGAEVKAKGATWTTAMALEVVAGE